MSHFITTEEELNGYIKSHFAEGNSVLKKELHKGISFSDARILDEEHFLSWLYALSFSRNFRELISSRYNCIKKCIILEFKNSNIYEEIADIIKLDNSNYILLEDYLNQRYQGDAGFITNIFGILAGLEKYNKLQLNNCMIAFSKMMSKRFIHIVNVLNSTNELDYEDWCKCIDLIRETEYIPKEKDVWIESSDYEILIKNVKDYENRNISDQIIKFPFSLINETYTLGGVIRGQLGAIVAHAGVGKSLWLQQVESHIVTTTDNINVIRFVIADLDEKKSLPRKLSVTLNKSSYIIGNNLSVSCEVANKEYPAIFDKKRCNQVYLPANKKSARDIVNYLERTFITTTDNNGKTIQVSYKDWYDVVMIDYDNVLTAEGGQSDKDVSLLEKGGQNTGVMKELADYVSAYTGLQKLVLVAMQPNRGSKGADGTSRIHLESISESIQKSRIIDFCIVLEQTADSEYCNTIGVMKSVKNRHSGPFKTYYFKDISGRVIPVDHNIYEFLYSKNKEGIRYTTIESYVGHRSEHGKIRTYYDLYGRVSVPEVSNYSHFQFLKDNEKTSQVYYLEGRDKDESEKRNNAILIEDGQDESDYELSENTLIPYNLLPDTDIKKCISLLENKFNEVLSSSESNLISANRSYFLKLKEYASNNNLKIETDSQKINIQSIIDNLNQSQDDKKLKVQVLLMYIVSKVILDNYRYNKSLKVTSLFYD